MTEIWKDIAGYDGWFQVSNLGRVRSVDRTIMQSGPNGIYPRTVKGKIMSPSVRSGYNTISFRYKGRRDGKLVHRLVAAAFIPNPDNLPVVNHLDYNPLNNRADNLEWVTMADNTRWSAVNMRGLRNGPAKSGTGEKYVGLKRKRGRQYYRVVIKPLGISKAFKTLEDAVAYRDEVLRNHEK